MLRALLDAGADPHARTRTGATPLHEAALRNHNRPVLELLATAGADLNARDDLGRTPLHIAARSNPTVFPTLLRLGADPEAVDGEGRTPIELARENPALQGLEAVRRKWPAGADPLPARPRRLPIS